MILRCRDCGAELRLGSFLIFNMDEDDEFYLCKECAKKYDWFICAACARVRIRTGREFEGEDGLGEFWICERCIEENGVCPVCDIPGGIQFGDVGCQFCTVMCDWCKRRVPKGSQIEVRGWYLCPDCYADGIWVCDRCGELSDYLDENGLCETCSMQERIVEGLRGIGRR